MDQQLISKEDIAKTLLTSLESRFSSYVEDLTLQFMAGLPTPSCHNEMDYNTIRVFHMRWATVLDIANTLGIESLAPSFRIPTYKQFREAFGSKFLRGLSEQDLDILYYWLEGEYTYPSRESFIKTIVFVLTMLKPSLDSKSLDLNIGMYLNVLNSKQ
jgi:hypothetical protein